ncbi:MAG: hypothetical protein LBQ48_06695, partial [Oscillospiraceae bacterium]|nr:hypothetical protein [Oscillospiraceae bacterium]
TDKDMKSLVALMNDFCQIYSWRSTRRKTMENYFGDETGVNYAEQISQAYLENINILPVVAGVSTVSSTYGIMEKISPQAYIASIKDAMQHNLDEAMRQ